MTFCPICVAETESSFVCKASLFPSSEYDVIRCSKCLGAFFSPLPSDEALSRFYSSEYYNFEKNRLETKGRIFAKQLTKISKTGNFLDVGCAVGFFINGIKKHSNWNVCGVEYGSDAVNFAMHELGLNVKQGNLWDVGFESEYFDYIHINNVLEHVKEPVFLLRECYRILKKNGTLFLSVPNGSNDVLESVRFYQETNKPAQSLHGHILFFSPESLEKILGGCGFKIETKKSFHFKSGFRALGLFPQKKNWKDYFFKKEEYLKKVAQSSLIASKRKVIVSEDKQRSYIWDKINSYIKDLFKVHNLNKYGSDYIIISRK